MYVYYMYIVNIIFNFYKLYSSSTVFRIPDKSLIRDCPTVKKSGSFAFDAWQAVIKDRNRIIE